MDRPRQPLSLKRFLYEVYRDLTIVDRYLLNYHSGHLNALDRAVLVLEDRRFFRHWGIDWRSVLRDFIRMVTFRRFGGSSTIEMQFVRTCTGYRQRTIRRKVYEMLLASLLQYRASKIQILKSYMAVVYLGHGVRGAQVAAAMLFSKRQLEQLTVAEACHIAAMMVYPMPKVPTERWRARVDRRANYALSLLAKIKLPH